MDTKVIEINFYPFNRDVAIRTKRIIGLVEWCSVNNQKDLFMAHVVKAANDIWDTYEATSKFSENI